MEIETQPPTTILGHITIVPIRTTIATTTVDEDHPNTYIINIDYPDAVDRFRHSILKVHF